MNTYRVRYILELIRRQGKLPTDPYGQILSAHEMLAWFGLDECLTTGEQLYVEKELAAMVEAELCMEGLKQAEQLR